MALSALEQAYLDYTMSSGAGSSNVYWGTALTGGSYGSVAGGKKGDGKKENAGQGAAGNRPRSRVAASRSRTGSFPSIRRATSISIR